MMNDPQQEDLGAGGSSFTESLDKVWKEIKEISRQVEQETRKSGRVARLKLDIRQLEKQLREVEARLGRAVYEAQRDSGPEVRISEVPGTPARIAALERLYDQIAAKEQEIETLRQGAEKGSGDTGDDEPAVEAPAGA